ncbi:hypothetical protein [Staphylococcus epidermidis]|uniref:hypothetical protein n=1 Tax=Staphylococcus epidermidis TaxID=1282 RepID=UPI0034D559CB
MEIILLLCSSGVAGLFTYIYLDYLSLLDTEKPEIKKMFSLLFSIISIVLFILVFKLKTLTNYNDIIENIVCFILFICAYIVLNKYIYPLCIKIFRNVMNKSRKNHNMNPFSFLNAVDSILQSSSQIYIEKYNSNKNEPILQGLLVKYQLTNDLDPIFIIEPTEVITDIEGLKNIYLYQPKNTDCFYKIYDLME